ncbi:MAG: NUDIX hydrolase [Candidatus Izemoplasmatales bacterium]
MEEKTIAAGILTICPKTERFLILKRAKDMKFAEYWNLPGGSIDDSDGYPKVSAIREFKEETGYSGQMVISKEPLHVSKSNCFDFYTYVGIVPSEFVPDLNNTEFCENTDYKWVSVLSDFKNSEKIVSNIVDVLSLKKNKILAIIKKFKQKKYE